MRTSVERLRLGLLVGAGLLVVVICAFLGYARYRVHRAIANLPGRLGATITRESNGYTVSQSDGKKTIFTLHAAKAVQHTDGKYTLHDVSMILYGHKGDRADRISGADFEYDTNEEVIRALGVVHLDLQAPTAAGEQTSEASKHVAGPSTLDSTHDDAGTGSHVIHVKTSGLVYVKKLGVAATDQAIEFAFGGFTGHAVGAEYNSDSGHLVLQSAITVSGLNRGHPVALAASHGELDRAANQAEFRNARYNSAEEVAQAEAAHLHMRPDGSVERIQGEGHVVLENAGQGRVTSDHADVTLNAESKPKTAVLTGMVRFIDDEAFRQARGESERANLDFNDHGQLDHAVLHGNVRTNERLRVSDDVKLPWSERNLAADTLELSFAVVEGVGKPQLRDVKATGAAHLTSVSTSSARSGKRPGPTTTKLSGDSLQAHFIPQRGTAELSTVHGAGHTFIEQFGPTGIKQSSSGEALDASFREVAGRKGAVEVATATQQGGVVINRSAPAKSLSEAAGTQHATAGKAAFDADTDRLTLTDNVQLNDAGRVLSAARVVMEQDSGDATAEGSVKVNYLQSGSAEPVHVLAARAELNHDGGRATFYGGTGLARLWQAGAGGQGGSQIEAPVLIFEQEEKRLIARSDKPGGTGTVHAVLTSAGSSKPNIVAAKVGGKEMARPLQQSPARITSSQMIYSDAQRQAEFTGGVRVVDASGEMRAQQATVFLVPASESADQTSTGNKTASNKMTGEHSESKPVSGLTGLVGGSVQRIVATKNIEITQPGRRATGDRLVYTANDQMFVLTGTASTPPKVVDAQQGTTTGAALRFHSGDDSVTISGRDGDTSAQKVHTETRVKQ